MDTFDVIFITYSPLVFRYLRSLSGDAAVAEELTAETFYRAYTHFDSFRGDSKLETWLCAIARNAYLKDCRRSARTVGADALAAQPAETDFVEHFLDREQARQIYRHVRETRENTMVATLDAKHRSCIFTNLPPETLYAVTVDGAPDVQLTVRSGLTFREAFSLMLQEL